MNYTIRSAVMDGPYRYLLRRAWGDADKSITFVMLNPSTAGGMRDDPTIRKCVGFASRLGYNDLSVVNLFAWRSTDPSFLTKRIAPMGNVDPHVGPENKLYVGNTLLRVINSGGMVVAAWGHHGHKRSGHFLEWAGEWYPKTGGTVLDRLVCLGLSAKGEPRHPLMLPYTTPVERYQHT